MWFFQRLRRRRQLAKTKPQEVISLPWLEQPCQECLTCVWDRPLHVTEIVKRQNRIPISSPLTHSTINADTTGLVERGDGNSSQKRTNDAWQIPPAPLAQQEDAASTRQSTTPQRQGSAPRALSPTQQLNGAGRSKQVSYNHDDDDGVMSEAETTATAGGSMARRCAPAGIRQQQTIGLVFLQYNEETKRALLPERGVETVDDVRSLFLKAFGGILTTEKLYSPLVKIYIQDSSKPDLFYELDDLRDVKDRSVLQLREQQHPVTPTPTASVHQRSALSNSASQSSGDYGGAAGTGGTPAGRVAPSPSLPAYYDDDMNYYSESELDMPDYRFRRGAPYYGSVRGGGFGPGQPSSYYPNRPASALPPGVVGGPPSRRFAGGPPKPPIRSPVYGVVDSHRRTASASRATSSGGGRSRSPPPVPERFYRSASEQTAAGYLSEDSIDSASGGDRSGSVTPVVDREARARMINMEQQLVSLSTLVHSALMSKGAADAVHKDIEMLRREILGPGNPQLHRLMSPNAADADAASDNGSVSRFSDLSSDKGSNSFHNERALYNMDSINRVHSPPTKDSGYGGPLSENPEMRQNLYTMRKKVGDLQGELKHLRRMAQINAQSSRDLLKDTFDKIKIILSHNKDLSPLHTSDSLEFSALSAPAETRQRAMADREQDGHKQIMNKLDQNLSEFESDVEQIRHSVINGERKLRMNEVEEFTNTLTNIGRGAASLKSHFPQLQGRLKTVMAAEMEKVVREEKFLKDEPQRMDSLLRRCKKLTNTMVTMKKLALVQDPIGQFKLRNDRENGDGSPPIPPSPTKYERSSLNGAAKLDPPNSLNVTNNSTLPSTANGRRSRSSTTPSNGSSSEQHHVLDTLLEELQTVAKQPITPSEQSTESDTMKRNQTTAVSQNGDQSPSDDGATAANNGMSVTQYYRSFGGEERGRRSKSSTPTSVNSEPVTATSKAPSIPPPPARYATLSRIPEQPPPPPAMQQTDALTVDGGTSVWIRSSGASSSESVNSQEGVNGRVASSARGDAGNNGVTFRSQGQQEEQVPKPPPPPPPPRNRQELLEQRQQELLEKQRQLQSQFHKLAELRNQSSTNNGSGTFNDRIYANFRR